MRQLLTTRAQALELGERPRERADTAEGPVRLSLTRRSSAYLDTIKRLDAAGPVHVDVNELAAQVEAEFGPGLTPPLGLLARCYLGEPFEVHTLDLVGLIVEHYRKRATVPAPFSGARQLALHPSYFAVEVYRDRFVCLRADGSAVEVSQGEG